MATDKKSSSKIEKKPETKAENIYHVVVIDYSKSSSSEDCVNLILKHNTSFQKKESDNDDNDNNTFHNESFDPNIQHGYSSCIHFLKHLESLYSKIEQQHDANSAKIDKILFTIYLPFRTVKTFGGSISKMDFSLIPFKQNQSTKISKWKINQYYHDNVQSSTEFVNHKKSELTCEINIVTDEAGLDKCLNQKDNIYVIIPANYYVHPLTLLLGYNRTKIIEADVVFNFVEPNVIYMNQHDSNFFSLSKLSFLDKNYFLHMISKYSHNSDYSTGFQEECLVFYKNMKESSVVDSGVFLNSYQNRNNIKLTNARFLKLTSKATNPFSNYSFNIGKDFINFPEYLPEMYISEKIANVDYWIYQNSRRRVNTGVVRSNMWAIFWSFICLFFYSIVVSRTSYLSLLGLYAIYLCTIALPQILKKDIVFSEHLKSNNQRVRSINDKIKMSFDWQFMITYYLFPLNRIALIIVAFFMIVTAIFKRNK